MVPRIRTAEDEVVGFIDIGTNSIRLLLVRSIPFHSHRVLTQQKETVRLGEGEFLEQRLQPDAMRRAVLVCRKFTELAHSYGADRLIAVATSATREAVNQEEFLTLLKQEAGLEVQVISGREEARLIYLGVSSGVNIGKTPAFFIDIGGGSTEVIVGDQQQYLYLDSLKLGAIRLTSLFLADEQDPISPALYGLLQKHVRHVAIRTMQRIKEIPLELAFGSSGTIENLAEITARHFFRRKLQKDDVITHDQLKQVIQMLCGLSLEERRRVEGINPERADIIIGGAAILDTFLAELGIPAIAVSDRGLRDGLLIDNLARKDAAADHAGELPLREHSVVQLGRACGFDEFHANHVAQLALELFDSAAAAGLHPCGDIERELLEYAAVLHDIGAFLSYTNHQAHTYYLIRNADLLGFNQEEIAIIAATAFFHRRTFPRKKHPEFAGLDKEAQKKVAALSVLLRIAESLDRSHTGIVSRAWFEAAEGDVVPLRIEAIRDCQLELWGLKHHEKAVKEAFGKQLAIEVSLQPEP
jgi:exopolyphosphatase/guanosine-5'-triphosphate,3'-diphosphate pyrophosphatase